MKKTLKFKRDTGGWVRKTSSMTYFNCDSGVDQFFHIPAGVKTAYLVITDEKVKGAAPCHLYKKLWTWSASLYIVMRNGEEVYAPMDSDLVDYIENLFGDEFYIWVEY